MTNRELTDRVNVAYKNEWHGFTFLSQLISKNLMLILATGTASENISAWSYFVLNYTAVSAFYSSDNRFIFEGNKLKVRTNISQGDSLMAIMVCDV
jgi:hypothetical protein